MAGPWEKYAEPESGPWAKYGAAPESAPEPGALDRVKAQTRAIGAELKDAVPGLVRGAGTIGNAAVTGFNLYQRAQGRQPIDDRSYGERAAAMDAALGELGANTESNSYKTGKLAGEVAGTAGAGGVLANLARAGGAAPALVNALASNGFTTGVPLSAGKDLAIRSLAGAASGGAQVGLASPENAGYGAVIGGALPGVLKVAKAGGELVAGAKPIDAAKSAAVARAQDAGYVLPPNEIKSGVANTLLEGLSGKIKTSQAASQRNQSVTNALVKRDLGLPADAPITKDALNALRSDAGKVYGELKDVGTFAADDAFAQRVAALRAPIAEFEKQFPELANKEVGAVLNSLDQKEFSSGAMVEALKRLRFAGNANKVSMDPAKKELGRIQTDAARALEDLVDRNLTAAGNGELLQRFKDARTLIAKTHNVEKALNEDTGNVSAKVLGGQLAKGKTLSGDLETVARTANAFPKATQTLAQDFNALSPLDYATAVGAALGSGNPLMAATLFARPAARTMILSKPYQGFAASPDRLNALAGPAAYRALPRAGQRN